MPEQSILPINHILGVILCGGRSSRFGSPKPFFEYGGVTLLERTIEAIQPHAEDLCLAVGDLGDRGWPNVRLVFDRIGGIGPIAGLHAVLLDATYDWLLALPVDVPFMTQQALLSLRAEARSGDAAVVATDHRGSVHPLCGLYHRSIGPEIERAIGEKEYSLSRLLAGLNNVRYVTLADEALRNVNRPDDLP